MYWVQEHNPNLTLTLTPELLSLPSGDGYAQNSELTEEPPAVRYRPDQHRSSGTGMASGEIFNSLLGGMEAVETLFLHKPHCRVSVVAAVLLFFFPIAPQMCVGCGCSGWTTAAG